MVHTTGGAAAVRVCRGEVVRGDLVRARSGTSPSTAAA